MVKSAFMALELTLLTVFHPKSIALRSPRPINPCVDIRFLLRGFQTLEDGLLILLCRLFIYRERVPEHRRFAL